MKRLDRFIEQAVSGRRAQVKLYRTWHGWQIGDRPAVIIADRSTSKPRQRRHPPRAALAAGGHTVTLYEQVHPRGQPTIARGASRVPEPASRSCHPRSADLMIVTVRLLAARGTSRCNAWAEHWVGRVRNRVYVQVSEHGAWQLTAELAECEAAFEWVGACAPARPRSTLRLWTRSISSARQGRQTPHPPAVSVVTHHEPRPGRCLAEPWVPWPRCSKN